MRQTKERERLVLENLSLVRPIACKLYDQLPELPGVSVEDLVSAGIFGLISAVDSFKEGHNIDLETYAHCKIRIAILESLRSVDRIPQQPNHSREGSVEQLFERIRRGIPELLWAHALKTFGSASLAVDWFVAECGALGNRSPIDTMNDDGGGHEIDRILGCIDYGMLA